MLLDKTGATAVDFRRVPCDASVAAPCQHGPLQSALACESSVEAATEIAEGCTYHRRRHNPMIVDERRGCWPSLLDWYYRASTVRWLDLGGQEQMAAAIRQKNTNDCLWPLLTFQDTSLVLDVGRPVHRGVAASCFWRRIVRQRLHRRNKSREEEEQRTYRPIQTRQGLVPHQNLHLTQLHNFLSLHNQCMLRRSLVSRPKRLALPQSCKGDLAWIHQSVHEFVEGHSSLCDFEDRNSRLLWETRVRVEESAQRYDLVRAAFAQFPHTARPVQMGFRDVFLRAQPVVEGRSSRRTPGLQATEVQVLLGSLRRDSILHLAGV